MIKRRHVVRLAWREYLPLILTIALWGTIFAVLGHADAVRLFAATIMVRAIFMLTRVSTAPSLRARVGAEREVRRQARRMALFAQGVSLCAGLLAIVFLVLALRGIGQDEIAAFLPLIAIGMPARVLRFTDVRTNSHYYRLALAGGGLALAAIGWAAGWHAVGMGLAIGARAWIAFAMVRLWPKAPHIPAQPVTEPLGWPEIGRNSVINARRLISYRLAKILLTVFGPLGNVAARTGRGMGWHSRIEPYLPHKLSGFILFAAATGGVALVLALRSGEPAAMVVVAGLMQLAGAATNIAALWRYMPSRGDVDAFIDDDDD